MILSGRCGNTCMKSAREQDVGIGNGRRCGDSTGRHQQIRMCAMDASSSQLEQPPAWGDRGCVHRARAVREPYRLGSGRPMSVHHLPSRESRAESSVLRRAVRARFSGCPGKTVYEQRVCPANSPSKLSAILRDNKSPGGSHHQGSVNHTHHSRFAAWSSASPERVRT